MSWMSRPIRSLHMRCCSKFLLLALLLSSCSNKYNSYLSHYDFHSPTGLPDYSRMEYWAAHPGKWDPSDSVPAALRDQVSDSSVDVFFIHPTTYTKKMKSGNAAIDDDYVNAKTDYSTILYQASVFNGSCRVFSPRYRQAAYKLFFEKDDDKRNKAFEIAFRDVATAFEYYLAHWNHGRPIIIAGHSQGAMIAERLLKVYFDHTPLYNQLVAAYVPGWSAPRNYFESIPMCTDSLQTGCICSWRTLRKNYHPDYFPHGDSTSYVTNPLTWTIDDAYAPRNLNKGSVLFKFNKLYKHTTDAKAGDGFLYVSKPKFPWSFLYFTRNYHIGDINLFYVNVRENIAKRIYKFEHK